MIIPIIVFVILQKTCSSRICYFRLTNRSYTKFTPNHNFVIFYIRVKFEILDEIIIDDIVEPFFPKFLFCKEIYLTIFKFQQLK